MTAPPSGAITASRFHIEVSALGEARYTGVSQVAAGLCGAALAADRDAVRFIVGRQIVPTPAVETLLGRRDGSLLDWHLARSEGALAPARADWGRSVGIYPNRKFTRRLFDREVQVVHDLSTMLMPQHHAHETVLFHNASYRADAATNDLTLCPSEATAADVRGYLPGIDPARVRVLPLGHLPDPAAQAILAQAADRSAERYVIVLGTLEPRKNLAAVLDLLARSPALLDVARFVFVGRAGWGASMADALAERGLGAAVDAGRIVITGFILETAKALLLGRAALVLYPSLFEGFGLPVLEALAAGVPVVTTRSSSIPEAGGTAAFYFDPFVAGDLDRAVYAALFDPAAAATAVRDRQWASRFDWATTWSLIKEWVSAVGPLMRDERWEAQAA